MTSLSCLESHVWIDYVGVIITWLMWLLLHWIRLLTKVTNIILHHLVQSK